MTVEDEYQQLTSQLLDQVNQKNDQDLFLTVYLPIKPGIRQSKIKKNLNQYLKSAILDSFKNNPQIEVHQRLPQKIVSQTNEKVDNSDKIHFGVGLFCQFTNKKIKNLSLVQFIKPPETKTHLGKTYDLDQLIWITNTAAKAVVININQKRASIYLLGDSQIKQIFHQKNNFLDTKIKDLKEYIEKKNFNQAGKKVYGSGTQTVEGEKMFANQLFLNQILNFIQQEKHLKKAFDHLVVFYTYPFTNLIKNLAEQSFIKTNFQPFLVSQNTESKQEIKDITIKNINQYQQQQKLKALEKAKENHQLFVKNWPQVIPQTRKKKIDILFITPSAKKLGFLDKNEYLWLKPNKTRKKRKNIAPWLVKSVAETNGKIIVLKDNDFLNKVEVAAQLRF